jgi:hypothetical protein
MFDIQSGALGRRSLPKAETLDHDLHFPAVLWLASLE